MCGCCAFACCCSVVVVDSRSQPEAASTSVRTKVATGRGKDQMSKQGQSTRVLVVEGDDREPVGLPPK